MLQSVHLRDVGPAAEMAWELGSRLNLITGDNGLGKSFLLDVAWWALTRTWAREPVVPAPGPAGGSISYRCDGQTTAVTVESYFDRNAWQWPVKQGKPPKTGLVLYAQVDGGLSVWDEARNSSRKGAPDRPAAFLFSAADVWSVSAHCEGLIRDWASWQREEGEAFNVLRAALAALSPSPVDPVRPGDIRRVSPNDKLSYPTLRMPYGQDVPVHHASAGMRRIIGLAYLLVWAWQEHIAACALRGAAPARKMTLLVDEAEAHLHPQWQRRIVPALLHVMDAVAGAGACATQAVVVTHSPLVTASVEPHFDPATDAWFDLDLEPATRAVQLTKRPFVRRGTADRWLTSEAFDLRSEGSSVDAEAAIAAAEALLDRERETGAWPEEDAERTTEALGAVLPEQDPFWVRWLYRVQHRSGLR